MKTLFTVLLLCLTLDLISQTENWDNYVVAVKDKPVSVMVNIGLKELAPAKERPFAIILRIKYPEMDSKGFPEIALADEMNAIENELEAALGRKNGAWYAGRFTQRGLREFYFYALDTVGYLPTCASILSAHPKYPWLVKALYDKNWSNYFEVLYPVDAELEKMENRRIIQALQKKGDNPDKERPIDHTIYFKSDWYRKSFLKELDLPGFKLTEVPAEKSNAGDYSFKLVISRPDRPEIQHMNELTIRLRKLAVKHNGSYEGWQTYVVK